MIEIKNIVKKYKKNEVLRGIDLTISDNEAIAILGSNGCGKTSLAEIIAKFIKPTSGEVTYFDQNKKNANKKVGMQFQDGSWPIGTRVYDLIKFFKNKEYFETEEFKELSEVFSLQEIIKKDMCSLSGGQRQRTNCFLSIINKPDILILDELITGLDLEMQIKLVNFFKKYKEENKIILLIVSHIPEEVESLCERIIILKDGLVYEDEKLKEVQKKYGSLRERMIHYYEVEK
ncbi:ATP-binding cassette domain-containing protein [Spiroplasma floricola]|uniref:ABC transporter ATP-binding protein n=1 Tax=Spiroplasma floricola 23-6 TaxID=1336749 RepID=A0A2K8SCS0_9MOLU|nr:ABC transporter ATP-binding protein [Spiroplasma floricola]AUB31242.1 ABC transporter ATP-binding protein [Spiroplasma floricola 23-6]